MKVIRIAHLYYDLMNLYGENGNVRALVKSLENQGVKVIINFLSLDDEINFKNFDFFYIGEGTIENTLLVLNDLKKYKKEINKAVEDNKFFLITGDTISIFGQNLEINKTTEEGLGVFPFTAKKIDFRIVGEQFYNTKLIKEEIIGFQNRETIIDNSKSTLFKVDTGTGFKPNHNFEGINKNNFYGTYLLGPLLVRNPYLNELLVKKLLKTKEIKHKKITKDISYTAYEEYLKNFQQKNVD